MGLHDRYRDPRPRRNQTNSDTGEDNGGNRRRCFVTFSTPMPN